METTTVTNRKKTNNDTVESNSDYDETDNNNNNNIRPDDNKYITDEGVKTSVNPFIDKFLKYTESLGLNRSTKTATLIIVLTIIVIVLYVFIVITPWSTLAPPAAVEVPNNDHPVSTVAPADFTVIKNFSDTQLTGVMSGRLNQWYMDMRYKTVDLLNKHNTPCATPWLEFHQTETVQEYYNMLALKDSEEIKVFVNVHDIQMNKNQGSSLTTDVPIKFKSNKMSRHYFNELTFKHADGVVTTRNKEQAFCIQELY